MNINQEACSLAVVYAERMGFPRAVSFVALLALCATDARAGDRTAITVWGAPSSQAFGGATYGGIVSSGAMITETRDVEVQSGGELRITGIAATLDPATVHLRSLTAPDQLTIAEQRFVPGATTPDALLARHIGDPVTIVTARGDVTGVLRSADAQALVVEVGTGAARRLQVMRRDGYVQDIRLPAGTGAETPSLVWRLGTMKPGKHTVEVTYRAVGLTWSADYLAVFDETARTVDFFAWATVRNATGTAFDSAALTLISSQGPQAPVTSTRGTLPRQSVRTTRFDVPNPVRIGNGESVQVELVPSRRGAKARSVITFEAVQDLSPNYQVFPAIDCAMLNLTSAGTGRAAIAIEVPLAGSQQLPEGRVRVFKRAKGSDRLDLLVEDHLRTTTDSARIQLARHGDLTGERRTSNCTLDERARTLSEKVEVKLQNAGKQPADVVVREYMWRFPVWRIDPSDESVKGVRAGAQAQEYRITVPARGTKTVTYTVQYSGWPH